MSKNQNNIFFSLVNYAISDDYSNDWAFKTSLLTPTGINENLSQNFFMKKDKKESILQYFNEVKPYHCQFTIQQDNYTLPNEECLLSIQDNMIMDITIRFDRKSCIHDIKDMGYDSIGYDTDGYDMVKLSNSDYDNMVNRLYLNHNVDINYHKNILKCGFNGYTFDGDVFKSIGFDTFNDFRYDSPHYYNYYFITDGTHTQEPDITIDNTYEKYEQKPLGNTIFEIPPTPFTTKKIEVFSESPFGYNRTKITDFEINNNTITLINPPDDYSIISICIINYERIYDTIAQNQNWNIQLSAHINIDGDGFIRPLWEKGHPEELSKHKLLENVCINIEELNIPETGIGFGYDVLPYDVSGYDTIDFDTSQTRPILYLEDISKNKWLKEYPVINDGILLFENGLYINNNDFLINWIDNDKDDKNQSVIIDYNNTQPLYIKYFGYGGTFTDQFIQENNSNRTIFELEKTITDTTMVFVSVDGIIADFNINNNILEISDPIPNNSVIQIFVGVTNEHCIPHKQITNLGNSFILDKPPSNNNKILIYDNILGLQLYSNYYKKYIVTAFEVNYDTYLPIGFSGSIEVYLNNTLLTELVDYTISGEQIITFNTTPSFNSIIEIYGYDDQQYTISGNVLNTTINRELDIITFDDDTNIEMQNETGMINHHNYFILSNFNVKDDFILSANGETLIKNKDFIKKDNIIYFKNNQIGKVINITYFLNNKYIPTKKHYKTIKDNYIYNNTFNIQRTTTLLSDLNIDDIIIYTNDVSCLPKPNKQDNIPGIIKINNEIVAYNYIDFDNNILFGLERGYLNTSINTHLTGDLIIDLSGYYNNKHKIKTEWLTFNHLIENQILNYKYSIPKKIKDNNAMVYIIEPVQLDFKNATSIYLPINNIKNINRPGKTIIKSPRNIPTLDDNGIITFTIQNKHSYDLDIISENINDLITQINNDSFLNQFEIKATLTNIILDNIPLTTIVITMGVGGSLVLTNKTLYPLMELFGGEITGSIINPTVIVDGENGIIINGNTVIFTNIGGLSDIINDINNANIPNIIARNKNDRLQIVNLLGQNIIVQPTPTSIESLNLGALGIFSSENTILSLNNNNIPLVNGIISDKKGIININSDTIYFDYIDNSEINNPKLYNYYSFENKTYDDILYADGYSLQLLDNSDYYIQSNGIYLNKIYPKYTQLKIAIKK